MASEDLPNIASDALNNCNYEKKAPPAGSLHPPRILILYGSLRIHSFSRKLALETERILQQFGAETHLFEPHDLPMLDSDSEAHPKVQELRALSAWSEGHVWISPEHHGTMTGVFKNQIDWLPAEGGRALPTQGRTLAVMQVSGGSQSFNVVNTLRVLGRWLHMVAIPNQSSIPKVWQEFDEHGRMKPSMHYDRMVDVMEELIKFTLMVRDRSDYLFSHYDERKRASNVLPHTANQDESPSAIATE